MRRLDSPFVIVLVAPNQVPAFGDGLATTHTVSKVTFLSLQFRREDGGNSGALHAQNYITAEIRLSKRS
jgi:hypothetical protein